MAVHKFRPAASTSSEPSGSLAVLPPRRERLAIVSTRNKLCGIAAYTQALERQLADIFDVTVFDLDQYLLRGQHLRVRALGDRHIKEICRQLGHFDAVNLQLEYGTLGRSPGMICRRFAWLAAAAPRLSVTFHSFKRPQAFPIADFVGALAKLKWRTAADIAAAYSNNRKLAFTIPARLRREQRRKPVSIIVHNRRDLSEARHLHGLDRVFDHPLAFLAAAEASKLRETKRQSFTLGESLSSQDILIGVFGFLNNYKGFGTSIRALRHISKNHKLLIFGGVHPNEIRPQQPLHPYIASLLEDAYVDQTLYDRTGKAVDSGQNLDMERYYTELFGPHPRDLSARIHFMGAPNDEEFLAGMAMCDVVVFPYLEVGQSSSGPISQAVELGCRIIASRTYNFLEFATYHPNTIEFFDIGNHLELAERIAARRRYPARAEPPRYNVETNKAVYLAANSAPDASRSGFRSRFRALRAIRHRG